MNGRIKNLARLAVAGTLALGFCAAPVSAQFGEAAGLTEIMHPEYLRRDITIFVQGLDLDETQQVIIEALFDEYEGNFHAGLDAMQQRYDDASWREQIQRVATDKNRVLELAFQPLQEWATERRGIGEQFLSNVRVLLSPQQIEQWPEFERMFRREKTMHLARLSGEQANLFHVVRDMHLDAGVEAMIRPVMMQYSVQLDEALRRRNTALNSETNDVLRTLVEADERASIAEIDRQTQLRIAVREVNDTFVLLIAQALPAGPAEEFQMRAMESAYPRIFRPGHVERMYEVAVASDALTPAHRAAVEALWTQYMNELDSVNQQLLAGLQSYEPQMLRRRAEQYIARQEGSRLDPIPNPNRDGFQNRSALHERYIQSLKSALPAEVFAELPGAQKWVEVDK